MIFNYRNSQSTLPVYTLDKSIKFYEHIKYASFDEYIKENPNCCSINPGGDDEIGQASFLERIFGYGFRDVMEGLVLVRDLFTTLLLVCCRKSFRSTDSRIFCSQGLNRQ
ncbi:hypothetical protein [Nostoc sp.]|uniref:hypothetical protein n=1 Tax=Nostoc sp. TaxID=1180 RepID=UPI002FF60DEC